MSHPHVCTGRYCTVCAALRRASGAPSSPASPPLRTDCTHRGERLADLLECKTCPNARSFRLKTYRCDLHGPCVLAGRADGATCCATCADYSPPEQPVNPLLWSYGVTTVPSRRKYPLPRTLASLALGGFDAPRLFVDGEHDGSSWSNEFKLPVTCAGGPPRRVVTHWILSMLELYYREPFADRYALFQDDLITYKNLRLYLDQCPYPERGYLNLYTFPENDAIAPPHGGWFEGVVLNRGQDPTRFQKGLGAMALVFSNLALRTLFTHPGLFDKAKHPSFANVKIDGGIVNAMNNQGWREVVHTPSLVQHTGAVTSRPENTRIHPEAPSFLGESYDALRLLKEPTRAATR